MGGQLLTLGVQISPDAKPNRDETLSDSVVEHVKEYVNTQELTPKTPRRT